MSSKRIIWHYRPLKNSSSIRRARKDLVVKRSAAYTPIVAANTPQTSSSAIWSDRKSTTRRHARTLPRRMASLRDWTELSWRRPARWWHTLDSRKVSGQRLSLQQTISEIEHLPRCWGKKHPTYVRSRAGCPSPEVRRKIRKDAVHGLLQGW